MKFTSSIIVAASGSVGGSTYSRNRFGNYIRNRAIPVNPNTSFQAVVRNLMSQLVSSWTESLTGAQRDSWDTYAANVPVTDKIGQQQFLTGQNHYIRSNLPRLQAGMAQVLTGPPTFDLGTFTPPVGVPDAATDHVELTFTETDAWVDETGSAMLVYLSRPFSATRNFFRGPYQFAEAVLGNVTTPPASPADITAPFVFSTAQKLGMLIRVTRADGRLSTPFRSILVA